jgi:hypothetical protein
MFGAGHNGYHSDMLTFNVGIGFGGEQPLLCMFGASDNAVLYGLSQSGETGDVPGRPYSENPGSLADCAAAFSKAHGPGSMGGVIPGYLQSSCILLKAFKC